MNVGFWVPGIPRPQGSRRYVGNGVSIESSKHVKPWRADVRQAAIDAQIEHGVAQLDGPLHVQLLFFLPRPKGHYGSGRNADVLRDSAPALHTCRPDIDKLIRAVLDAATSAGLWLDDSQVSSLHAHKSYADAGRGPGLDVEVETLS